MLIKESGRSRPVGRGVQAVVLAAGMLFAACAPKAQVVAPPQAGGRGLKASEMDYLACGSPSTPIHQIQGSGPATPVPGLVLVVEGVVTGDFQGADGLRGFYLQEEDAQADADPNTSEGLFVFDEATGPDVDEGDVVRLRGEVGEHQNQTQLSKIDTLIACGTTASVSPVPLSWPFDEAQREAYEGMKVALAQPLTVTDVYGLGRFGEVVLSASGRQRTPTDVHPPGSAEAERLAAENTRNRLVLDDASARQNPDPTPYPAPGLSADRTLRVGDTTERLTGILAQGPGGYKLQPTEAPAFKATNPRPEASPSVGGALKVAGFNVLNYFNGDGQGGGFPTTRGASTPEEFARQQAKIVAALAALDADVVGLTELENDEGPAGAAAALVAALNAEVGAGTYRHVETGIVGTDQIRVGFLYKPGRVALRGRPAVLDSAADARFIDRLNRPSIAQSFEDARSGGVFTVVVNHFKSKGSDCDDVNDPDRNDGQGNCNGTRTRAAEALADWVRTDPTGSGDPDFLLIGDFNAYGMEDPIRALQEAGFARLLPADAYSYVFGGQSGSLDHALASPSLARQVAGAADWHVNADEPNVLDYNVEYKSPGQVERLYRPGPFRSSDHDPIVVGLDLVR